MEIINCKELSENLKTGYRDEVASLREITGECPNLTVILVGEDPASQRYVRNKERACEMVGIETSTVRLPEEIQQEELLRLINRLNNDTHVNGILVQLPLPNHLDSEVICNAIDPVKDVDGFTRESVAKLWLGEKDVLNPCTPRGVIEILDSIGFEYSGKKAVVVGRSKIVGLPMSKLLLDRNCTVTVAHSRSDLKQACADADLLIAAIGKPKFISPDTVGTQFSGVTIVDVGINVDPDTGKLCGDVDADAMAPYCKAITPVPGGVGPMTVTMLLKNTIRAFRKQNGV